MKDRYLFRGKRIDNGEWVQGFLSVHTFIPSEEEFEKSGKETYLAPVIESVPERIYDHDVYEVDPFTICQCTGLKDKTGKLIWENDILSLKDGINGIEWKAIVEFGNPNGEYTYGWQLVPVGEFDGNKDILLWVETEMEYMKCEVIGNAFDNPELLEVQE